MKINTRLYIKIALITLIGIALCHTMAVGQDTDYQQSYLKAKKWFDEGDYAMASQSFKGLINTDPENNFKEYSSFYFALSNYYQSYHHVARDMLLQIRTMYPKWHQMPEVDYWLGVIYFELNNPFRALEALGRNKKSTQDTGFIKLKEHFIPGLGVDTLTTLYKEYPDDQVLGLSLAHAITRQSFSLQDRQLLDRLAEQFDIESLKASIGAGLPSEKKKTYNVAVMLPFVLKDLTPDTRPKPNQLVLDLYEGIRLAVDSLNKNSIKINLKVFDTERDSIATLKALSSEFFKDVDLIIGPLFNEPRKVVMDFCLRNKVNMVNPISKSSDFLDTNPFMFLFQPTAEELAQKAARYAANNVKNKNSMIFLGPTKQDSLSGANFLSTALNSGIEVVHIYRVNRDRSSDLVDFLTVKNRKGREIDPADFEIAPDSIGSIFVASDDNLIYTKVISAVETRGDSIVVIGSDAWLDHRIINLRTFQNLGVVLTAPNFIDPEKNNYKQFRRKYLSKYGKVPTSYSSTGYELMLFFGDALIKNGNYFQVAWNESSAFQPGHLSSGFYYRFSNYNKVVPFIKVVDDKITLTLAEYE